MADSPRSPDDRPTSPADDGATTWTGRKSLDRNWWWSPALLIVVGVAVIAYQYSAIVSEQGAIVLNWVLVAIGAGVIVAGLVSLKREWATEKARRSSDPAGARPREGGDA